jgi:diguanylate cyclase (GGDEF)-like protein
MFRINGHFGLHLYAALTTAFATIIVLALVVLMFPDASRPDAMRLAPYIVLAVAYPLSLFIWQKVFENKSLNIELQRLVNRDRLTDVATRDFFFSRMQRDPTAYGISLMVDIDHFKLVNDTYGHLAGDAVIRCVADILRRNIRENDLLCRFGGEEFIVFLHEMSRTDGFNVAERMRKAIASEVVQFDGQRLAVTVSIGGSMKQRIEHINIAIKHADDALYRAKNAGRNRTIFATAKQVEISA